MSVPVLLLVERDPARSRELSQAFRRALVEVVVFSGPESAQAAAVVSPQAVVYSLLAGKSDAGELRTWLDAPVWQRLPLLAVVPPENEVLAEAAVRAGATDVLPWPAPDAVVRSRIRSVVLSALLQEELAAFPHVLEEVVRAYEGREAHTIEHSARVARLSAELGRALGLSPSELERLRQAALIHNLGMLAIPAEVMGRPEALTADEEAIIRSHPRVGAEMLRSVPALEPLRPFVLMHHERIDGSGYPEGLSGAEIPLPVRILALTEAYDALTSTRPWRPARTHEGAMEVLRDEARAGRWNADLVEQLDGAVARLMRAPVPAERRL